MKAKRSRTVAAHLIHGGFDVMLVAALISLLLLLQPRIVFGEIEPRSFLTQNKELRKAVGRGPAYIDFWASWCGPCKESLLWLASLKRQGINVVTVNLDSNPRNGRKLLNELAVHEDLPVIFDPSGKLAEELQLSSMPESILVSSEGKIVSTHSGFTVAEQAFRERDIRAVFQK